jgi:hypothetical protein
MSLSLSLCRVELRVTAAHFPQSPPHSAQSTRASRNPADTTSQQCAVVPFSWPPSPHLPVLTFWREPPNHVPWPTVCAYRSATQMSCVIGRLPLQPHPPRSDNLQGTNSTQPARPPKHRPLQPLHVCLACSMSVPLALVAVPDYASIHPDHLFAPCVRA